MPTHKLIENSKTLSILDARQGTCLHIDNSQASAVLSLFGAHLLSFKPKHDCRERLWLSENAVFDRKTPIRGGIPICWPWFGAHPKPEYPSHGFARTQDWQLVEVREFSSEEDANQTVATRCTFEPTQLGLFDYSNKLSARLDITIANTCTIVLTSINRSDSPCELSQAIHTYFAVPDIAKTEIAGINSPYYDKVKNAKNQRTELPYSIFQELDRVHQHQRQETQSIQLFDVNAQGKQSVTLIEHKGHSANVVWNPWQEKSRSMKDMSDSGYKTMLCIEAATLPAISLLPGESCQLSQCFD